MFLSGEYIILFYIHLFTFRKDYICCKLWNMCQNVGQLFNHFYAQYSCRNALMIQSNYQLKRCVRWYRDLAGCWWIIQYGRALQSATTHNCFRACARTTLGNWNLISRANVWNLLYLLTMLFRFLMEWRAVEHNVMTRYTRLMNTIIYIRLLYGPQASAALSIYSPL